MFEVEIDEDTKIARYLDLPKFLDIIHNSRLYFCQVDKYDDILEGIFFGPYYDATKAFELPKAEIQETNKQDDKWRRQTSFVSCWTLSEHENMGLWNVYGGKNSICIETTVSNLYSELNKSYFIRRYCDIIGNELRYYGVLYIDHHNDNVYSSDFKEAFKKRDNNIILCKNIGFSYENEVRFLYSILNPEEGPNKRWNDGFHIVINTQNLIKKIYTSPNADPWFIDLVKGILLNYDLADRVYPSKLGIFPYCEGDYK